MSRNLFLVKAEELGRFCEGKTARSHCLCSPDGKKPLTLFEPLLETLLKTLFDPFLETPFEPLLKSLFESLLASLFKSLFESLLASLFESLSVSLLLCMLLCDANLIFKASIHSGHQPSRMRAEMYAQVIAMARLSYQLQMRGCQWLRALPPS